MLGVEPSLASLFVDLGDPGTGWFKVRARLRGGAVIDVYESFVEGERFRYSYVLVVEGRRKLGYDNAPHHRGVPTYPHHKHVDDRVEPLEEPYIESFLKEALQALSEGKGHGKEVKGSSKAEPLAR